MSDWPAHVEACKNCTGEPSRYAYGAHGYCNRCYRIKKRIEDVRGWNRSCHATRYSKSTRLTDEQFEICREEHIRELERRLDLFRDREEIRRHEVPVDALSLEQKFAELLHLIRRKAEYPCNASDLNAHFNEAERRVFERIYPTGK
jgi:hypothetical protein